VAVMAAAPVWWVRLSAIDVGGCAGSRAGVGRSSLRRRRGGLLPGGTDPQITGRTKEGREGLEQCRSSEWVWEWEERVRSRT
jgi:hypothetical protein